MEIMAQTLNAMFLKYGPATDTRLSIVRQCTVNAVWYEHAIVFVYRTAFILNNSLLILVTPIYQSTVYQKAGPSGRAV